MAALARGITNLVNKIPFKNENARAFTASVIIMGGMVVISQQLRKDTRPGHGLFDSEKPEAVRLQQEDRAAEIKAKKKALEKM